MQPDDNVCPYIHMAGEARRRQPVYVLMHPTTVEFDDPRHCLPSIYSILQSASTALPASSQKAYGVIFLNHTSSAARTRNEGPGQKPVIEEPSTVIQQPEVPTRHMSFDVPLLLCCCCCRGWLSCVIIGRSSPGPSDLLPGPDHG